MHLASLLVFSLLAAGAQPVPEAPTPAAVTAPPQASSTAKPADLDRIICRQSETTGTRIPSGKTCHTKREWEEKATITRQDLDQNYTHQSDISRH
jgi:hypothetical protein